MSASCNPATPARALPRSDSLDASLRSAATAAAGEVAALRAWAGAGAPDSEDDGDSPASELRLPRPPLPGAPGSFGCPLFPSCAKDRGGGNATGAACAVPLIEWGTLAAVPLPWAS